MKYKTFRAIAIAALVVVGTGAIVAGARACGRESGRERMGGQAGTPTVPLASAAAQPPSRTLAAGEQALREIDRDILNLLARPMSGEKIKDAFSASAYKVNVYRDAGFAQANRLKIDFDRDENDDEKWTIEGSGTDLKVKRQSSPSDDNNYTEEYLLIGGVWAPQK